MQTKLCTNLFTAYNVGASYGTIMDTYQRPVSSYPAAEYGTHITQTLEQTQASHQHMYIYWAVARATHE